MTPRPRKPNPQHVILAVRLDSPLVAALDRIAQRQASTRSALMRRYVEEGVARNTTSATTAREE